MIMIRQKVLLLLICTMCLSAACTSGLRENLVGKWQKTNPSEGWEFRADNSFEMMTAFGIPITGNYIVDGENVVLKFDPRDENTEAPEPLEVKITVSGNEMTLNDGQRVYTYSRTGNATEKAESSRNLNTSTTITTVTNTSNGSVPEQSSGVIQARSLLEYENNEDFPSRPKKYEGKNVTVTGSFGEYSPQLPEGKTIWLSDKAEFNGSRVACRIVDSEVKAATKLKKDQEITVNGTVGKYEHGFYLDLHNCKIASQ